MILSTGNVRFFPEWCDQQADYDIRQTCSKPDYQQATCLGCTDIPGSNHNLLDQHNPLDWASFYWGNQNAKQWSSKGKLKKRIFGRCLVMHSPHPSGLPPHVGRRVRVLRVWTTEAVYLDRTHGLSHLIGRPGSVPIELRRRSPRARRHRSQWGSLVWYMMNIELIKISK